MKQGIVTNESEKYGLKVVKIKNELEDSGLRVVKINKWLLDAVRIYVDGKLRRNKKERIIKFCKERKIKVVWGESCILIK